MSNGITAKSKENKFFTIEFFGVTLIVTTFVLLIALLFGEDVLFELGLEVQYFLLGAFGYFSYPLLISVNYVGFMLLFGKKINSQTSKRKITTLITILFFVLTLLTIITGEKTATSFKEYTHLAYLSGRNGVQGVVAGGWLFSLITFVMVKYLKYVGAIIVFSLLFLAYIALKIKNFKKNAKTESENVQKQEVETNQSVATQPQPQVIVVQQPYQPPQPQFTGSTYSQPQQTPYQPTEREIFEANKQEKMQILYGRNPYEQNGFTSQTYAEGYNSSFARDRLNLDKPSVTTDYSLNSGGDVSSPISKNPSPNFEMQDNSTLKQVDIDKDYNVNPSIEDSEEDITFYEEETTFDDNFEQDTKEVEEPIDIKTESTIVKDSQTSDNIIENIPKDYKYKAPPVNLLENSELYSDDYQIEVFKAETKKNILDTLKNFGIDTTIARIYKGPAVTRFDIVVPFNLRMEEITRLQKNINLRIAAKSEIRMIAPVPSTSYVGIEVPNQSVETVKIKDIVTSNEFCDAKDSTLTFALGKDVIGKPVSLDIVDMPHLLVTGTTGSGKSVCLNSLIISLLYKYSPLELRFIIVDPKFVDLEPFHGIPHMLFDTIIEDVKTTSAMLTWLVDEMDRRYRVLATARAKNLKEYNRKAKENNEKPMPRLVVIIDEFADIMKRDKKGVGDKICLLAQKARASGIHLILAAQRPSVDIIEGPIKSNLSARIVFKAASLVDSRVSLGESGAEKLLGRGDCLYKTNNMPAYERVMGAYVSDDEMYKVIDYVTDNNEAYFDKNNWSKIMATCTTPEDSQGVQAKPMVNVDGKSVDPLYIKALKLGIEYGSISTTFLQRKLAIGFPRAGKIVDWLTDNGYISIDAGGNGKKKILITKEEFNEKFGDCDDNEDDA